MLDRNRMGVIGAALLGLGWLASGSASAATIDVGTRYLFEDKAGQEILILVSAAPAEQIQGLNFRATIADGGLEAGGQIDGPMFQNVNLLSDTIFAGNNTGQQDLGTIPQVATFSVTTASGTVNPSGVLARVTIDTTGFFAGASFDLRLGEPAWVPNSQLTDFAGVPIAITHGSIVLIPLPEPFSLSLCAAGALMLLGRPRRGR